jgi:hypothetical protein
MRRLVAALVLLAAATPVFAAPAPAWRLTTTDGTVILTNVPPDSDEGGTSFNCTAGEKAVHVFIILDRRLHGAGAPPWRVPMAVVSGAVSSSFKAKATPDEENGGTDLEAVVPTSASVMAAFAHSGAIRLSSSGETIKTSPVPPAKAASFVKTCAGR